MAVDIDILREALLHAQYAGRDTPRLADFPATVTPRDVSAVFLPHLAAQEAAARDGLVLGDIHIVGHNNNSSDNNSAVPTLAGDAVAAALVMFTLLGVEPGKV
ncbi:hypothetical protein LSM04_003287 [Trypanosoma melophagium]|uniref:uncharacterized protein n=1 Tax=Trypanosoma melophagium TaxID=715481 RepID=UPI00351A9818|nr:hypothetical protein LSM04_003287 [Trypanosoma melophagium]